jgi:hypothetical protein
MKPLSRAAHAQKAAKLNAAMTELRFLHEWQGERFLFETAILIESAHHLLRRYPHADQLMECLVDFQAALMKKP